MSSANFTVDGVTEWLRSKGVKSEERARAAAEEIVEFHEGGDREFQTVYDVLGDHLLDGERRPKDLIDELDAHFDLELVD